MPEDLPKSASKSEPDPMDNRPPFLISIISVVACGLLVNPVFALQAPDWNSFTSITAVGTAVVADISGWRFVPPPTAQFPLLGQEIRLQSVSG